MPRKKPDPHTQNPNELLDKLLEVLACKNDAAMCRLLEIAPPVISKMRHGVNPVSPAFLIKAHDATGLSINDLRALLYAPLPA
jgi:DNA-binding transcriptional regulator YdaS (Cro superfamily)